MLAAVLLLAQDFTQYKPVKEIVWTMDRVRVSADLKHITCDRGVLTTADWSQNGETVLLKDLIFTPDPERLLAISSDGLFVYARKDFRAVSTQGVSGNFAGGDISPDGRHLIGRTSLPDGLVVVTDWESNRVQQSRKCDVLTFASFVDREKFVTVGRRGIVHLWSLRQSAPLKELSLESVGGGAAAFSPDRRALYVLASDGVHRVSTVDFTESVAKPEEYAAAARLEAGAKGGLVAVWTEKSGIAILTAAALQPAGAVAPGEAAVKSVSFSPEEKHLVVADASGRLRIFKAPDWKAVGEIQLPAAAARVVAGPDLKWILAATARNAYVYAAKKK